MPLLPLSLPSFFRALAGCVFLAATGDASAITGDNFAEAVDLGSTVPVEQVRPAFADLTLEPGEEQDVAGSHWLTWLCPAGGLYEAKGVYTVPPSQPGNWYFDTGWQEPIVRVYEGATFPAAMELPYVPLGYLRSLRQFRGEAGRRYHFRTGLPPHMGLISNRSAGGNPGMVLSPAIVPDFTFSLRKLPAPPPNDDFANAAIVPEGDEVTVTGTNEGASDEPGEEVGVFETGDSVWHRWTAAKTGRYEMLLRSPAFLRATVFYGEGLETVSTLTNSRGDSPNYNDPSVGTVRLRWDAQAGEQRMIRICGSSGGRQGSYSLRIHRLLAPVNDNISNALPLAGPLPLRISGSTVDASPEEAIGEEGGYSTSSVWWKWTPPETGWCELGGNVSLGIITKGARLGSSLEYPPPFRFRARAGQEYFLRAVSPMDAEGPVELSLRWISGLENTLPGAALDMGSSPSFSSAAVSVPPGYWIAENGESSTGTQWCRWTAPVSGWAAVDTEGAADGTELSVRLAEEPRTLLQESASSPNAAAWQSPYVNYSLNRNAYFFSMTPVERQIFPETLVQDTALAPRAGRLLLRVTAGQTYFLVGVPPGTSVSPPGLVKVNLRPAAGPPDVLSVKVRDLPPATARDTHVLEAVIAVSSPNGLVRGNCGLMGTMVYFTEADRISGDVWDGEYRVVVPLVPGYSSDTAPPPVSVSLVDARGGYYYSSAEAPLNILSQPPAVKDATVDHQAPMVEGGLTSSWALTLNPLNGLPPEPQVIQAKETPVTVLLRLGIRDFGGSGFAAGEIYIASDGSPVLNNRIPMPGSFRFGAVPFGPEHRRSGDALLGIYEVPFTVPAYAASGRIMCRLRDTAGNVAGGWVPNPLFYSGLGQNGGLSGWVSDTDSITLSGSLGLLSFSFEDSVALPYVVEQTGRADKAPPVISEAATRLDGQGNILISGRITDDLSGVAGGEVLLADKFGLVEARAVFTTAQKTAGTGLDGQYEISLSLPRHGFGGAHYLSLKVRDQAGWFQEERRIGPLTLPDRTAEDQRRPRLAHFQISPAAVDLTAGPAEISVSLGAGDDRPGITAVCRILDSAGQLLTEQKVGCDKPALDCVSTLKLPRRSLIGLSAAARVELVLRDSAGRQETYGQPGSPAWPEGAAVSLALGPVSDPFTLWAASWPGLPALPPDDARDSDQDGVPDLLEFALGSDPTQATADDVFAATVPKLLVYPVYPQLTDPVNTVPSLRVDFRHTPSPAFSKSADAWSLGAWRLRVEQSTDLLNWTVLPPVDRDGSGDVHLQSSPAMSAPGKMFRLRVSR